MTDYPTLEGFDCVKFMREQRDRLSKEMAGRSHEEFLEWLDSQEYTDPTLRRWVEKCRQTRANPESAGHRARATAHATKPMPYPRYKPSGVNSLGDVPEHWRTRRLKYSAVLTMGQSPLSDAVQADPVGVPFLQGCAEFGPEYPVPVQYCHNPPKIAPAYAMLLSVRAPVGSLNVADQDYGIGRGLCAIQPGAEWHDRYAYWQLHVLRDELRMVATGSTYDAVSVGDVANLIWLLPTATEQYAIATFLDRETAKIDALIGKNETAQISAATGIARREIELLQEYRTRLISDAVTGKLDVRGIVDVGAEAEA